MNLQVRKYLMCAGVATIAACALSSISLAAVEVEEEVTRAVLPSPTVNDLNAFGVVRVLGGILTNEIDPVRRIKNPITGAIQLIPNECGTTCFSGNVAVHPHKRLLVNEINPVKIDPQDPRKKCIADEKGITCFSGIVGANEINPHKSIDLVVNGQVVIDECTKRPVQVCVPDDSCGATTSFSGDIKIRDKHIFGQAEDVELSSTNNLILKFTFNPLGSSSLPEEGAFIRLYFFGRDSGNSYDVFYRSKHYINPAGSAVLSQHTRSAMNNSLDSVQASFIDSFFDVFIQLNIDTGDTDLRYRGCLHYELVGCDSLIAIECNPVIPG